VGVEIRLEQSLTDEERQALFGWGENIFGVEDTLFLWRPKEWHFITQEDERVVSHVGVMETKVSAGGQEVKVGGIGGVVTIPEAQGQRYVHAAMRLAVEFMCERLKVEFGMLFCLSRLVPFYAGQGWRLVEETVEFEQPTGTIVSPFHVMITPCGERAWPEGKVEVGGLPW
jgi:aminoglycoside 2'-N-acetyltransferase I